MAGQPDPHEEFADAEIDGLPQRSGTAEFLRGALLAVAVLVVAFLAWSAFAPQPGDEQPPGEVAQPETDAPSGQAGAPDPVPAEDPSAPPSTPPAGEQEVVIQQSPGPVVSQDEAPSAGAEVEGDTPTADTPGPVISAPDAPLAPDSPSAPAEGEVEAETDAPEVIDLNAPPDEEPAEPPAPTPTTPEPTLTLDGSAFEVNARAFAASAETPLLAIVLTGAAPGTIAPDRLVLVTAPLTLGIPATADATQFAGMARDAGHEVLAELDLIATDTPLPDGEEALRRQILSALVTLPMAVGATTPSGAALVSDRRALDVAFGMVAEGGHAFVHLHTGIGTVARSLSEARGIPFASGDRYAAAGATPEQIFQSIESAAFQARREGTSIVAIPASEAAFDAVVRWGLQESGDNVSLAPISAVVRRRAAGG